MRARRIEYRLRESEYRALHIEADRRGVSTAALVRLLALEALDWGGRLTAIEAAIRGLPNREQMTEAFNRIAARLPIPPATGPQS